MKLVMQPSYRTPFPLAKFQKSHKGQRPEGNKVKGQNFNKLVQGDKKSTQQVNYGKTTHLIFQYSCWSPQGIIGDLDFSNADLFSHPPAQCAQCANFFFKGRKFEIDLRVKQKQIEFLFPVKST